MSSSSPHSPRRQRKALYSAATFERRRRMTVPLSRELRARFHRRAVAIRKGDTVRVLSGSFVGREERVARVVRRDYAVVLDNVTLKSGEDKLKPLPIRPGHLVITRLNLSDAWRRRTLRVADEDVTPEERGEPVEAESAEAPPAALPAPTEAEAGADAKESAPAARRRKAAPAPSSGAAETDDAEDEGSVPEEDAP
ncbi:MAG TPA: 50S ribosomal protein L24 [Thermoplasmata archaeon]|nr:50S ribosomal protein L24 [Thermoplasmata archaeon]